MRNYKYLVILVLLLSPFLSKSQDCYNVQLLDGTEPLLSYGMDSTYHWWAVTAPFTDKQRLHVDGYSSDVYDKVQKPVFSPATEDWASFVENNGRVDLITNDSIYKLNAIRPGEIAYAPMNGDLVYSYFDSEVENIIFKKRKIQVSNRTGKLYVSLYGRRIAFMGARSGGIVINSGSWESTLYEEVKPFGYWFDGRFMYAAKNGNSWEVYLNDEAVSQTYQRIFDLKINQTGNVAAFLAQKFGGSQVGVMIADEYYEPMVGKDYDQVTGLALHPYHSLYAYKAKFNNNFMIVFNTTEYTGFEEVSTPEFTHNGSELYYIGCNMDCSLGINGRNHPIDGQMNVNGNYAIKPEDMTIAYSSNTSLIVRNLTTDNLSISYMVDRLIPPRYNRFDDRYEALGDINNRLYMLYCK